MEWICELPTILTVIICMGIALIVLATYVGVVVGVVWVIDLLPDWVTMIIVCILIVVVVVFFTWATYLIICG